MSNHLSGGAEDRVSLVREAVMWPDRFREASLAGETDSDSFRDAAVRIVGRIEALDALKRTLRGNIDELTDRMDECPRRMEADLRVERETIEKVLGRMP